MITLEKAIDDFIESCKVTSREKEQLQKLLKGKFIKYAEENGYEIKKLTLTVPGEHKKIKKDKVINCLEDIVTITLQRESRDKQKTAERLRKFITYLNVNYDIGFDIEEGLPKVFSYEAERQLDLLKAIHEPQTKSDLMSQYAISEKTLGQDLKDLEIGKSFLGQNIRIDRLDGREMRYVSSVHPIFMAMNLSEIFSLTIGLRKLGENTSMKRTYTHIANIIYNQLSPYAQKLIKARGEELGIHFIEDKRYRDYRQEKLYKESNKEDALLYAAKSGERCKVTYKEDGQLFERSGHIKWKGNAIYELIENLGAQEGISLEQEQIIYIEIEYK